MQVNAPFKEFSLRGIIKATRSMDYLKKLDLIVSFEIKYNSILSNTMTFLFSKKRNILNK